MASGTLTGPAPDHIFVIKTQHEIRYFASVETFAQAIIDAFCHPNLHPSQALPSMQGIEFVVYSKGSDGDVTNRVMPEVAALAQNKPQPPQFDLTRALLNTLTPQERADDKAYGKSVKEFNRNAKAVLSDLIERSLP